MKNNAAPYVATINIFGAKRILVIGDLLLDVYLKGSSTRLCPEAPVPVVDVQERTVLPGGAANTVCNLRSLGASVTFCTALGMDPEGDEAISMLVKMGVEHAGIVRDPSRKTITKSRVVSGSQVIARIDEGSENPVNEETTAALIAQIEAAYPNCDGIVISDYDKGVITPAVRDRLIDLQARQPKFIAVDSKRLPFFSRLRPALMKPNYGEAIRLVGAPAQVKDRIHQVSAFADTLYEKLNAELMAVTLDSDGSIVIKNGEPIEIFPAPAVANPHVSGAGDTYLSAFVLSYLHKRDVHRSGVIATAAASIAIRKEYTSACSQPELKSYFNIHTKYISNIHDLNEICDAYHKSGKRIVFTNGCFDILHSGHVSYLHRAKERGDILIVGLNTDESIKRIKGENRPINGLADRLKVLAGLSSVDHIIAFGDETDDTPVPLIRVVRPHIFAKGGDYTKEQLPEAETVLACGGEIVFLDHVPDHSTTRIINRIHQTSNTLKKVVSELPS
jgi:D-beta-D-heptose 7-phosphate kinase/D-beta-D-heptose 1-phosphate adenosyltransferase